MLVKRFLTPELKRELHPVICQCGFKLDDIIRSGLANPDGKIGVYAGCEECYQKFTKIFTPIIEAYHQHDIRAVHTCNFNYESLVNLPLLDTTNQYIVSTRIRVGRNVKGFSLPPAISKQARQEVETKIVTALSQLDGQLKGRYFPLKGMSEFDRLQLIQDHFLFKKGDRFLEAAGANRDWPSNRGIFHSEKKQFLVWINEEDQMRIISMQQGSDIIQVFKRLIDAIHKLEEKLCFQFNEHLGFISSCPTNLGTALRASVHIRLPRLSQSENFVSICDELALSVRGIHGEHSESEGGVWDISNKHRLGLSEVECVKTLYEGVKHLIHLERTC